jgi:squalene-hopene/tetraprenyl-beta-curcumene cyclase
MTPKAPHQSWGWFLFFRGSTSCCARSSRCFRKSCARARSTSAVAFIEERLNGEDGSARSIRRWPTS